MANNFPVVPPMGLAGLQYSIDIAGVGGSNTTFPPGSLHLITYTFETVITGGVMQFDYTTLDQDAHETQMRTMLNNLAAVLAGNMGIGTGTVQGAMSVTRTWIFVPLDASNQVGYQFSDKMPYP